MRVGIIADDLTGAADTAAQFARAGWNTELQLRSMASAAEAIAVTTDSRALAPADASAAAASAVSNLQQMGITQLYKKIDSTLRGQVRAEVHGTMTGWSPRARAVVCPAFPAAGRLVLGGHLHVNGVRVSETAIADDPVTPVTESHIPTLLGASQAASKPG